MSDTQRSIQQASLKWADDGELLAQDIFNLICRVKSVEPSATINELWRLGLKYPKSAPAIPKPAEQTSLEAGI